MNFWIDCAPRIRAVGENIAVLSRSGEPKFVMPRHVAMQIARQLLVACAALEDRQPDPPVPLRRRRG